MVWYIPRCSHTTAGFFTAGFTHMQPPPKLPLPSALDIHPLIEAKLDQVQGLLNCRFFSHQAGSAAVVLLLLPAWLLHTTHWLPPTQQQVLPEVLPASATPGKRSGELVVVLAGREGPLL
jgi:hypothetical protein